MNDRVLHLALLLASAVVAWGVLTARRNAWTDPRDVNAAGHDEWLLDEALAETFPASDPISPAR